MLQTAWGALPISRARFRGIPHGAGARGFVLDNPATNPNLAFSSANGGSLLIGTGNRIAEISPCTVNW
jgi:hypothetical protein